MNKPKLLVTCKPGNEEWCENEIGNVLFHYDKFIRIERTRYPALLLVYTELEPTAALRILESYEYGYVKNIIPIQIVASSIEEVLERLPTLLKGIDMVRVKLRIRGRRGYSPLYWRQVMSKLKEIGVSHSSSSSHCLHIEVIDDMFLAGLKKCPR